MQKQLIINVVMIVALLVGIGLIANKIFGDNSEKKLLKKWSKFFDEGYFLKCLKKVYKKEISYWQKKGYRESEILWYISKEYFDYLKTKTIAKTIFTTKGTLTDDEDLAIRMINNIQSLGELSYLAFVFKNQKIGQITDMGVGEVFTSSTYSMLKRSYDQMTKGAQPLNENLLTYMLNYFSKKHRVKLIDILKSKPKCLPYKKIKLPNL